MPAKRKSEPGPKADKASTALIAGGGRLPVDLAHALKAQDVPTYVVMLDGEVENPSAFSGFPQTNFQLEALGGLLAHLKARKVERLVFAGTVKRRPRLLAMRPLLPLLPVLARLAAALGKGDDALLRSVVGYAEEHGIAVVGAHQILPDLLVPEGVHTRARPNAADRRDIAAALEAALAIGALDIGQAAVAIGGRAVALEGIEGTDGLLERVAGLRKHGRLAGKAGGVLVKSVKPGQELRTDLPGIGVQTVEGAAAAGLRGIAVVADSTLAIGFRELVERADALGVFVVGLAPGRTP
ncbi:MAG: UDP-2,3-diacylglucosamine diphosphatase LpxI [Rhizobiaceae bacterium]|nr:UDP-2,3-diacylglucosamine diphosphatase LpxI [Rhizobiaceae bacterium]